jgi:phosphatidylethanolamine/phosphatidyl-N-methylethanolamine N-methyltransferase
LLAHGIRGDALLVLELNEELYAHLHARFPRVRIELGDAQQYPRSPHGAASCPMGRRMRSCPALDCCRCRARRRRDPRSRVFMPARWRSFRAVHLRSAATVSEEVARKLALQARRGTFVLRNVPPATVYVYTRDSG